MRKKKNVDKNITISHQLRHNEIIENICRAILEGEDTDIGRAVTIERIKDFVGYKEWCSENI